MTKQKSMLLSVSPNSDTELLQKKIEYLRKQTLQILEDIKWLSHSDAIKFLTTAEGLEEGIDLELIIKMLEVKLIKRALEVTGGRQTQAAKLLSLKPTTLNNKIKRYGINCQFISFS